MRKRFEQQMTIGSIPIGETKITSKKRSVAIPGLCTALKEIFITPEWNERVFEILETKIMSGKKRTGRPGMDLWQVFVLSQVLSGVSSCQRKYKIHPARSKLL